MGVEKHGVRASQHAFCDALEMALAKGWRSASETVMEVRMKRPSLLKIPTTGVTNSCRLCCGRGVPRRWA